MSPAQTAVLFLRLEGALQSWGDSARWTVRPTRLEPTKSGILGLLACVCGWGLGGDGDRRVAELARGVRVGVREDRPGRLVRDYHTVEGGVLSAEGKIKRNASTKEPETVVSERFYLADACFLAAIWGPESELRALAPRLEDPVWVPFLGRRSCPPAAPLVPVLPDTPWLAPAQDLRSALEGHPWIGGRQGSRAAPSGPLRAVLELAPGEEPQGPLYTRQDDPRSFSRRVFLERRVEEVTLTPPTQREA